MQFLSKIPSVLSKDWNFPSEMPVLYAKSKNIPGSWQFQIKRYAKESRMLVDEQGALVYHYNASAAERFLEFRFCVSGQSFCGHVHSNCEECKLNKDAACVEQNDTVDILQFRFEQLHLSNLIKLEGAYAGTNALLNFKYEHSFSKPIVLSGRIRQTLDSILNHPYKDEVENIFINAQTQVLLLYCLEALVEVKEDEIPACKFLEYAGEREKIMLARELLLKHIGDPITIKELSRKVAINECYLKKGFRVMYGTTIFDFYQDQRMEHARYLLYEKGLTVSEVSAILGYSSISHFSTAFKKHTGLKPCELLGK